MDELDSWMRRYINGYRLQFIDCLVTEKFLEGFPGLQDFIRERAKNFKRQDGYFLANSLLLDSIIKIDDFPALFIQFCEKYEINAELVRIVRAGVEEYHRLFGSQRIHQGSQNLTRSRSECHRENAHIPHTPNNADQGSASQGSASQGSASQGSASQGSASQDSASQDSASQGSDSQGSNSTRNHRFQYPFTLTNLFQNQSDNVDRANLLTASNNIHETTNEESVAHEGQEETTDDIISVENAACLVNVLECTVDGFKGAGGNAGMNISDGKFQMPCPCPYHTNAVENNLNENNARRGYGHESEASSSSSSSSDTVNMQRVELETSSDSNMQRGEPVLPSRKNNMDKLPSKSTASNYDPNIDRRDPVQKTSHGDKAASMAEHLAHSHVNVSDVKNNPTHEINNARGHLKNNTEKYNNTDSQFQEGIVSKANTLLGNFPPNSNNQNVSNSGQREITLNSESWESFYLSSSDEEDLLPAQNAEDLEIDNLKENQTSHNLEENPTSHFEEPMLRFHIPEVTEDNFQRDGSSETSKVKFIVRSIGLAGIECQEDLDKFKTKEHTEERVTNNSFGGEVKKRGDALLENSAIGDEGQEHGGALSDSKNLSRDVKYHLKASDHRIVDDHNTVAKTVDGEDYIDKHKSVTYGSSFKERNESLTSLTNPISSETDLKEGNNIDSILPETTVKEVNEITEVAPQQQACGENQIKYDPEDFHLLHLTASTSNVKESEKVTNSLMGSNSLPLAVACFSTLDYAGSSEGFEIHTSDDLDVLDSDVSSVNRSSDNVSEGSQPFIREVYISEPPSTQTVSMPLDMLSINTSSLIAQTHSGGQQQSNTHCQTMKDDNFICTESCQNDRSDYNINFSDVNPHSSENSPMEVMQINNSTFSNIRITNFIGLLTLVKRIIEVYFPELSIRL